jgi:hypothetical protein
MDASEMTPGQWYEVSFMQKQVSNRYRTRVEEVLETVDGRTIVVVRNRRIGVQNVPLEDFVTVEPTEPDESGIPRAARAKE